MNKKILAGVLLTAILIVSCAMTGCGSEYTPGTENLTDDAATITCTSEDFADPQAVKLHSLSEQLFADTWAACGENKNFLISPLSLIEVMGMVS